MAKQSAGILLYKISSNGLLVFLVHPGGPFFKNKDAGSWGIPKGEFLDNENALTAAKREFAEETGFNVDGDFTQLNPVTLKSGKVVYAWALQGDIDAAKVVSNNFETEWPPKSGKLMAFPEVDRGGWFSVAESEVKINPAQFPLIVELQTLLNL